MKTEEQAKQLLDRYRRDALLLQEPYPPPAPEQAGNSHFGGLPRLPANIQWPSLDGEVPLHFLAQIDCAELPVPGPLPDRGVLFFFAWDNEEQIWDESPNSTPNRVIYVPDGSAAVPLRAAPPELPPIGDSSSSPHARPFLKRGEPGPNVHPWWPVVPITMPSWPSPDALSPEDLKSASTGVLGSLTGLFQRKEADDKARAQRTALLADYRRLLEERQDAAFVDVGGTGRRPSYETFDFDAFASGYWAHATDREAFPSQWLEVSLFARAVMVGYYGSVTAKGAKEEAEGWLARAAGEADTAIVPDDDRAAFRRWVEAWRHPQSKYLFDTSASRALALVGAEMVRRDAVRPGTLVSAHGHEVLAPWFPKVSPRRSSQMLGYPPASQHPLATNDRAICLLQLSSYSSVGWMFGDMGEASFWIEPEDLARRDFSKIWAKV